MSDTTNTKATHKFVVRFDGSTDVDGPLDLGIGTPVTFSGTGRISGQSLREPYLKGEPVRAAYDVTIESVDDVVGIGSEHGVKSVAATPAGSTPTKSGRVWGAVILTVLFLAQAIMFVNIGVGIASL